MRKDTPNSRSGIATYWVICTTRLKARTILIRPSFRGTIVDVVLSKFDLNHSLAPILAAERVALTRSSSAKNKTSLVRLESERPNTH